MKSIPKEVMARMWDKYNWKEAEAELLSMQQELVKAAYAENMDAVISIQKRIVRSDYAKMLAVKKVCSVSGTRGTDKSNG